MKKVVLAEKLNMIKNNHKIIFFWIYKISNLFKKNILNNGERYDPNVLAKFNINDFHQEARYYLAETFISDSDSVLDIACGTGYGTLLLSNHGRSITGVDISRKAIDYANNHYRTNPKINFVQSDIFEFNESADIVISFETIEHVNGPIESVVKKLLSLTGKKLICSVPYKEPVGNNKYHFHFNISELDFDFLNKECGVTFLYQSGDGKIWKEDRGDIATLIVIVDKNVL